MSVNFLLKRSNTADKRPTAANLDIGELALNYEGGDPGIYFEDSSGDIRKVGPVTVGASAPNSSPAVGGSTGNSVGEQWFDTGDNTLKTWDGSAWQSPAGTVSTALSDGEIFVGNASNETEADAFNDVLTAQAGIDGSATTATRFTLTDSAATFDGTVVTGGVLLDNQGAVSFEESTVNGNNFMAFTAPSALTTTTAFILPDGDGTSGQFLSTNGSGVLSWSSAGAASLTNGNIFVGNASGLAADVAMSGDATIANTGAVTIANDAITTVKILDDAVTGDKIADNVALAGNPTTTTQTAGDNSTRIATTAYVDAASAVVTTLPSSQFYVGDATNTAAAVNMSGDATLSNTGAVTIANDAVTTAKILDDNVTGDKIANDVALAGNPTTTTQTAGTNNTTIATTAYADTAVANIAGTYVDVAGDTMTGNLTMNAQSEIRFADSDSSNFIALEAPATVASDVTFVLPDADGTSGQALVTDGSGALSWATTAGAPGGADTQVQFNNAGSFDGNANFTFNDADEILSVTTFQGDLDGAVVFTAEASVNITKGQVVYIDGIAGNTPTVNLAQANSSTTMPAFGIADTDITSGSSGHIVSFGQIGNLDTDTPGFALGETLYVSSTTAGALTNTAPTGEGSLIQNVGRVERVSTTVGRVVVAGAGRANATPNLNSGNFFLGNASNEAVTASMSGDATMDNAGAVTIANDAVTTVKILDDAVTGDKIADNVALAGSPTTTTQSAGTNNTTIATTAYVDTAAGTKLDTTLNDTQIFVGNGSNVATGVAMSGDATIANTGALTIANDAITSAKILDDTIVNADINSSAAIDYSKMAAMTAASILVGNNSNVPTVTAVSGDVTLSDTGVVDIIDNVNLGGNPTTTTQLDTDNSTRIATTAYVRTRVDNAIQGLDSKQSVRAATTGNIALSGAATVDGISLSDGDRILVKDQTASEDNGIYVVATGAWARSDDANTWDELVGAFVFVESGTANADSGWVTQTVAGGTLGTTAIPWVQFSGAGQITAGDGMTKTGNTLDVVTADATRIVVASDSIDLATTGVAAGTYRSVTTDTYGRITAGTNPTTFSGYGISDTSANLAAAITDETGTGSLVFASSPALAGTPTAPTASAGDNSTTIATTAYADSAASTVAGTIQWELNGSEIRPTADSRDVVPVSDGGASLGTSSLRWANVYTQDMHFSNEGTEGNSVDGTTGDWTLQEGADNLYLINNKTGNKFRISMEPV